jgi:hypothetical protein
MVILTYPEWKRHLPQSLLVSFIDDKRALRTQDDPTFNISHHLEAIVGNRAERDFAHGTLV